MSRDKLLDAIGEIDDVKIEKARAVSSINKRKKIRSSFVIKLVASVAVIAIVIVAINYSTSKQDTVIYASSYDSTDILNYDDGEKLTYNDSIKKIDDNSLMRVVVWVRGVMEAYEDIESDYPGFEGYTQADLIDYDNETLDKYYNSCSISEKEFKDRQDLWSCAYNNIIEKALAEEELYLERIGGRDITKQENNIYVVTIKKKNLSKLKDGKCKYVAVLSTKNDDDVNNKSLEAYYGEYSKIECIGVPLISSFAPDSEYDGKFIITEEKIDIDIAGIRLYGSDWTYEEIEPTYDFGMYTADGFYDGNQNLDLFEAFSTLRSAYKITDKNGYTINLYISSGGLYLDLGLGGLYRVTK